MHLPKRRTTGRRAILSSLLLLALTGCEPPRVAGTYEGRVAVLSNALVRMSFETNGIVRVTIERVESRKFVTTNHYEVIKDRVLVGPAPPTRFIIVNRDTIRVENKPDQIFRRPKN